MVDDSGEFFSSLSKLPIDDRLAILMGIDARKITRPPLPRGAPFPIQSTDDSVILWGITEKNWANKYNPGVLLEMLSKLKDQNCPNENYLTILKYLKEIRKFGLAHRQAWRIFTNDHCPPSALNKLIKQMGSLNDHLKSGKPDHIRSQAEALESAIIFYSSHCPSDSDVTFASPKSVASHLLELIFKVREYLKPEQLPIKDLHKIRKWAIRTFLIFFQLDCARNYSPLTYKLCLYLKGIYTEIGDIHDSYVQRSIAGDINYETEVYEIDIKLKNSIEAFLNEIESTIRIVLNS